MRYLALHGCRTSQESLTCVAVVTFHKGGWVYPISIKTSSSDKKCLS